MKTEIPDWVDETPDAPEYELVMWSVDGDAKEKVADITREEYIALKRHLAGMRGYRVGTAAEAVRMVMECESPGLAGYNNTRDEQQIARHLETARELYRCFPDLVVWQSDDFDAEIGKLAE